MEELRRSGDLIEAAVSDVNRGVVVDVGVRGFVSAASRSSGSPPTPGCAS